MTYKEIVDRIKDIVERHKMLHDFGYGNLSDIKANNEGNESADYPYAFLNPTNHTRSGQAITYRFNLIVMDMVLDTDYLKIQSECQQYIDDILAALRFGFNDQVDLTLNVSLTPFKERFQDVVAGMTATLEVVIPNRLSDCYNIVPALQGTIRSESVGDNTLDPDELNRNLKYSNNVEVDPSVGTISTTFFFNEQTTGYYEFTLNQQFELVQPLEGEELPSIPVITVSGIGANIPPYEYNFWPTEYQSEPFLYTAKYRWYPNGIETISFTTFANEVEPESAIIQKDGGTLTIQHYS